jgi:siderophore synthetase component
MTALRDVPPATGPAALPDTEAGLLRRLIDALLREDHLGVLSRGRPAPAPVDGEAHPSWWRAPLPGGRAVHLPVRPDGFLADHATAAARLVVTAPGEPVHIESTVEGMVRALAPSGDAEAERGWAAFAEECRQALAGLALQDEAAARVLSSPAPGARRGFAGLLRHEALAALRDHPVHPTGRCRWGFSPDELRRYAPEFRPRFALRWTVVPRAELRCSANLEAMLSATSPEGLPGWWPIPAELGVPDTDGDEHVAVPVHPLTAERGARDAVDAPGPMVVPTLSTRTVALAAEPGVHVKLPLPTATLGLRNRRTIKPGTLADGEAVHDVLAAVLAVEPDLAAGVLLADETCWAEGADELLAVLVRRYPREVAGDTLVPLAALLAPASHEPEARLLDELACGDDLAWFDRYLRVLLDWHVALWLRYGIALEAHQQNVTVAQDRAGGLRLVYKDDDGARIDCAMASAALGTPVRPQDFHDRRIAITDPGELADMVTTITLHLCVAALVVEWAGSDRHRRAELFDLVRTRLDEAARRWCDPADPRSRAAAALLRGRILDADRLPIKAMVTAGTLLPKDRLGCADMNKHYLRTGPNYLRTGR